ncbi:wax ester/triacylglycerol synthase family O-acyltransferase [Skermania sp. ID1734]|uniref:WS/DGAT/MGAT family O-acyltransferase n=1 Tax=Skermania sp. ID1734 TaxID=2597516 RepID=UPI00117D8BC4|nr:wax ester/triacylglycerol synthase family O-acyltransferase [Skermania sp. ID1734]TSE00427.1 wax ester/triacylglycerol synthase family O-acyltransferase [Skermania sp. ID1734]
MSVISPADSIFLVSESREHPTHVGALQLFELPDGADEHFVRDLHAKLLTYTNLSPTFRKRPADPVSSLGQLWWTDDNDVDLEHHVRLAGLARPGRIRELLEYVSRAHSVLLDRHRPLWEYHVIDGVEDNRFAVYAKMHHSLADGVSAMRMVAASLSASPNGDTAPLWANRVRVKPKPTPNSPVHVAEGLTNYVRAVVPSTMSFGRILAGNVGRADARLPLPAPHSMFNVPITGSRRFAGQSWPLERLRAAAKKIGTRATINDVLLAMCSGALRRYLLSQNALPSKPLIAAVPVSVRAGDSDGGNAIGYALCNLGTHLPYPSDRMHTIITSMNKAKSTMAKQSKAQVQLMGATLQSAQTMLGALPGLGSIAPSVVNVVISNVPGPKEPLYMHGAQMLANYPLSIPLDYNALNITAISYAGNLDIGIVGCRKAVPGLQRLLEHLEASLAELE